MIKYKTSSDFADMLRGFAEHAVGERLFQIFADVAAANPGKGAADAWPCCSAA